MESIIPTKYGADAVELPGARALLAELSRAGVPWAIVTSGTKPLVTGWLEVMKLTAPASLVTAEDVPRGKPDPACYRLGASRLGLASPARSGGGEQTPAARRLLVLEDAPAGVAAGKAAGFDVVALATTHSLEQLCKAGADWIVRDLRSVRFVGLDGETGAVTVEILDSAVGSTTA